ncbi:MAG: ABC transporter permease [Candidatus Micrarchaeia archaeon]
MLLDLAKNDFKTRYTQNYLGILWAFVQPLTTIMIFWFVFQVGFKATPVNNVPFILWLLAGMIPWFFLSESINSATYSIIDNSFLVKKIVFRVSLLPLVKITSALVVHIFFILVMFLIYIFYRFYPNIYWIQTFYFLIYSIMLVLGISWITSSVVIFFRDLGQIISMCIQFGFWLTPIFWMLDMVPEKYRWVFTLNPAYYIIQGYRNSLIYKKWFWEDNIFFIIYYWMLVFLLMIFGAFVFRKLRPHFADVL